MIKYCPHCGGNGFYIKGIMRGSVETYYDESGNHEETNLDKCYWESQSKVVRCVNCNKIRRDVLFDGKKIIEGELSLVDKSHFIFRQGNSYEGRWK